MTRRDNKGQEKTGEDILDTWNSYTSDAVVFVILAFIGSLMLSGAAVLLIRLLTK